MRLPLIIGSGLAIVAIGVVAWLAVAPDPADTEPLVEAVRPAPAPVAPPVEPAPAPAPAVSAEPRPAPTPPAPAPEPTPAPAVPSTGTLRVEADVPGATVFLDRVSVGAAPLTIPDVAPGSHRLDVTAPGYDRYSEDIDVAAGPALIEVSFKEIRLDAATDVVHKHGIGSCRGMLRASPAGVQFVATDGDDSFSVALADIGAFEVDYLGKNVRLAVEGGRTYNFTGPDGNADALFVFHETVARVLTRLADP